MTSIGPSTGFTGVLFLDSRPASECREVAERLPNVRFAGPLALASEVMEPAQSSDERLVACDARIDNRAEIAAALGLTPSLVSSLSPSALIARAYGKWGEECAYHLLGDFAFALWDRMNRRLVCARDHVGVKPFYYYLDEPSLFVFGSDIRSVLNWPRVPHRLNERMLRDYLVPGFEDTASTFYDRIRRLPPAHTLTLDGRGPRVRRYWSLDPERECRLSSAREYTEQFAELFTAAVRCRADSDDVGALLSGGLDSSSIVCTATPLVRRRAPEKRLPTFSAVFEGDEHADERPFIETVVSHACVDARFVRCDSLSPIAPDLFDEQPQPFWNPHLMMHRALFSEARRAGVRVLLDGLGGDSVCSYGLDALTHAAIHGRGRTLWRLSSDVSRRMGRRRWRVAARHVREAWRERRRGTLGARYTARRAHAAEVTSGIYPFLLEVMRCTADRAGVEVRYPFFDRRLMEFCLGLPAEEKLREGWPRAIQRFAMTDRLPALVAWRTSKGNLAPAFGRSLLGFEGKRLADWVHGPMQELAGFADPRVLRSAHARFVDTGGADGALRIWNAWTAASWLRWTGITRGSIYG